MTNETRTPEQIEREIESQRSDLTSNLEDLQDKFSIDTIVRQISDQFRDHGGDMGRSISEQVKANPVPLALTGIGIAWLMLGNKSQPASRDTFADDDYETPEQSYRRSRIAQNQPYTLPTTRVAPINTGPSWAQGDGDFYDDDADNTSVTDRVSGGAAKAMDQMSKGATAAKDSAASVAGAVSDGASHAAASAKASLANAASSAQDGMSSARRRIAEGTENLSEEGRMRVIAARQKAIELRRQTARSVAQGTDAAADFYDRQPLVVGALALAVGAAFGGALPRTKAEDDLMGTKSDTLMRDAERVFQEEKSKAMAVASSVQDEVKDIASETKADMDGAAPGDKSAVQAIRDEAKSAAARVADTAKTTAKDENLGKPKV